MISNKLTTTLAFLDVIHQVASHMEMITPPPRKSKHNKNYPESQFDYSYTTPLGTEFPYSCRGYTKMVLKSVYGNCLTTGLSYDVLIPVTAPNGPITFAWAWINRSGQREYYMNCADIAIKNGKEGGSITGHEPTVANLESYEVFPEDFADDYKKSEIALSGNNQKKPNNPLKDDSKKERPEEKKTEKEEAAPSVQGAKPVNPDKNTCTEHVKLSCHGKNLDICLNDKILTHICPKGSSCKSYNGTFTCLTF